MPESRETVSTYLSDIIVTPANVRTLARIISEDADRLKTKDWMPDFSFTVYTHGQRTYEYNSLDLFVDSEIIDTKQVRFISLAFAEYRTRARIQVSLVHDGSSQSNSLEVSGGGDSGWVNGAFRRLEDAISDFEKQAPWPRKWKPLLTVLAAFGIGRAWDVVQTFLEFHVLHTLPMNPRPAWAVALDPYAPIIGWVLDFLMGFFPALYLTHRLVKLWPSVELRMGQEWAQIARKRDRLWVFFTIAVAPIVVSFVYDAIKAVYEWSHAK